MSTIHFLNVYEGDCNIIQHDNGRITMIDVSNAYDAEDTPSETLSKYFKQDVFDSRNFVPNGKVNYNQKSYPDNPIEYLQKLQISSLFRFIITHPDMDHLDGIKDLFGSIPINCFWDTNNNKEIPDFKSGSYNSDDWNFYKTMRDGQNTDVPRRAFYSGNSWNYFDQDYIQILAPTPELIEDANDCEDYNDSSYVLLYTPPQIGGRNWKILFGGDSHDKTWEHIIANHKDLVSNVDILFAPHHGRGSHRSYEFLKTLNPRVTLFGNASHNHLDYNCYPKIRITNNQAGYVVMDISETSIDFYVKNLEFANNYTSKYRYTTYAHDKLDETWFLGRMNSRR